MALLTLLFPRSFFAGVHRRAGFWLATLTVSTLIASKSWAQTEFKEYQLKAVFLFNFAQFVEWPESAFANEKSPLTIGVIGEDPFDGLLDDVVRGEHAGPREITVRRFRKIEEVDGCQILFISKSESAHLESILAPLGGRAVLTVSDADRAARRGTMIRFATEKKKIRLRINLDATKEAGLVVSSKLLRAAEIVTTDKNIP
jgi:hypothetical protein